MAGSLGDPAFGFSVILLLVVGEGNYGFGSGAVAATVGG
jgi:hypothetical protein